MSYQATLTSTSSTYDATERRFLPERELFPAPPTVYLNTKTNFNKLQYVASVGRG